MAHYSGNSPEVWTIPQLGNIEMNRHLNANTTGTPGSIVDYLNNVKVEADIDGLYIDASEFDLGSLQLDAGDALALLAFLSRPAIKRLLMKGWVQQQQAEHLKRVAAFLEQQAQQAA